MDSAAAASPASLSTPNAGTESKAQEQARLRRERRNAKIQASGSDRLSKITSLSGRPAAAEAEATKPSSAKPARLVDSKTGAFANAPDPDEVDISHMQRSPAGHSDQDVVAEQQARMLRQMLAGVDKAPPGGQGGDGRQQPPQAAPEDDAVMRMMQQMLGGGLGTDAAGAPAQDGLPPGLAEMFGGAQSAQEPEKRRQDGVWRVIHAVCAVALACYVAFACDFRGSERGRAQLAKLESRPPVFWMFTTIELLLQSGRYFADGGKLRASGILGGLGRMLPEPYGHYVRLFSRYSIIYTTIVSDAMVVIFVLGVVAWWHGAAATGRL